MRDRRASDRDFEEFLDRVEPETLSRLILNDRLPLALTFPVGGLHLPEAGLPLDEVRRRHPNLRIGRSAHSARSAVETARLGADWVILGPAFPTGAKRTPLPAGELERAARESEAPVWAIGGIAPENVAGVLDSGVAGVAAIRSMGSPEAVRELRSAASPRC